MKHFILLSISFLFCAGLLHTQTRFLQHMPDLVRSHPKYKRVFSSTILNRAKKPEGSRPGIMSANNFQDRNLVSGTTTSFPDSLAMAWLTKFGSSNNNSLDEGVAIAKNSRGNICVTGDGDATYSGFDAITIQYDSNGSQKWLQRYNGPENGDERPIGICVDANDNVTIVGNLTVTSAEGTSAKVFLVKYDSSGSEQWERMDHPSPAYSYTALEVKGDVEGNTIVMGVYYDSTTSGLMTRKYDSMGLLVWSKILPGSLPGQFYPIGLGLDGSSNVYIAGSNSDTLGYRIMTVKYDSSGTQQWITEYISGLESSFAGAIVCADAGYFYVAGSISDSLLCIKY